MKAVVRHVTKSLSRQRHSTIGLLACILLYWSLASGYHLLTFVCASTALCFALYSSFKLPVGRVAKDWEGLLVGHRGVRLPDIPENTVTSIRKAFADGADVVEIDVCLTKDNEVVVFHDDEISRLLQGNGFMSDLTLAQAKEIPFRIGNDESERVPSLDEILAVIRECDGKILIETKMLFDNPRTRLLAKKVIESIRKFELEDRAVVISFDPISLYAVRQMDPEIMTCMLYQKGLIEWTVMCGLYKVPYIVTCTYMITDILLYILTANVLPYFLGVSFVGPDIDLVSSELIQQWRAEGIETYIWVANDPNCRAFLKKQGACVATDWFHDVLDR